jgi:hypothetical protein
MEQLPRIFGRYAESDGSKKSIKLMGFGFSRALLSFAPSRLASHLCSFTVRPALLRPELLHPVPRPCSAWSSFVGRSAWSCLHGLCRVGPEACLLSGRWHLIWHSAPLVRLPVLCSTRCLCSASLATDRPCRCKRMDEERCSRGCAREPRVGGIDMSVPLTVSDMWVLLMVLNSRALR